MICGHCGNGIPLVTGQRVGMRDTCPRCDADLHTCRNCRHYDPGAHHECREDLAEWVRDKARNNRCEYFDPIETAAGAGRQKSSSDAARTGFDALFKR